MEKVSVIIPCYNDGDRIIPIINQIKKSAKISEIIVVDDGSDLNTKTILSSINSINLINHQINLGKSHALLSGVNSSNGQAVLFIDSDLQNFTCGHVDLLINTFFDRDYDMVLGLRGNGVRIMKWLGFAQAYTGERIIRKAHLINHMELFEANRYLIEPAINKLFFRNFKVGAVNLKKLKQILKIQKRGLSGLIDNFKMYHRHLNYLGIKELFFQMNFAKRISKLTQ